VPLTLPFLWGAATSAHQVEGGNAANDWHNWELAPDSGCVEPAGAACDHLNQYPLDIALLAEIGLNCYRFSVEWSRVEPEPGRYSQRWIDHYRKVAQCCRANGLLPLLTLHHFTNPRWVAQRGGWERRGTAEDFARFCGVVAESLGELPALAITINEPNILALLGFEDGRFPPGKTDRQARLRASEVLIDGHRRAVETLRAARPELPVGMALAMADWQCLPGGRAELEETRHLREDVFLYATDGDDFVGVNTYTRHRIGAGGWVGVEPGVELTAAGYEFWPEAIEQTLHRAAQLTGGKTLVVTESGVATDHDPRRVEYIDRSLAAVQRAVSAEIEVRGFLYWSALDNFEWHCGYSQRFGLIGVDRRTQRRTVKASAWHLGHLARVLTPTMTRARAEDAARR
jgi:beta-glucosidase